MASAPGKAAQEVVAFGPFRLFPAERLIERFGQPVQLGSRATDLLFALVERAGDVVSQRDLIARIWPNVTVDDSTLRSHVAALRRVLGDGGDGARYVINVPGRGYCFVGPITRSPDTESTLARPGPISAIPALPPRLKRMVGRNAVVAVIAAQLASQRFVTIVGPGGIGKTTVAASVGRTLAAECGAVCFVDLGPLTDPRLVPSLLATALGLVVQSANLIPSLIGFLRNKRMLLILDGCEHVIETTAALAEVIFAQVEDIHILATSREALRIEGEHVYRLAPLDCPPASDTLTAAEALAFSAVQLFSDRVAANSGRFSDDDAPVVARICRKLDGIALAIELAAGRVDAYGIEGVDRLLDSKWSLLWQGRRTTAPRHHTLNAALGWSYDLLDETERAVLCRLAVFAGPFTLEAAEAVAPEHGAAGDEIVEVIASLVAKSLIASVPGSGSGVRYRLLDTTRTYLREKLAGTGAADRVACRHAKFFCKLLERAGAQAPAGSEAHAPGAVVEHLGDVRSALDWSFSERGDFGLGIALAAATTPVFLEMSLLTECLRWTERAIAALDGTSIGTRLEMALQSSLGVSLMFTLGNRDEVRAAFQRGLELAEVFDDRRWQIRLLRSFHLYLTRVGDFCGSLDVGRKSIEVARSFDDVGDILMAEWMLGVAHHLIGNQKEAAAHCESAMTGRSVSRRRDLLHLGYDHRIIALVSYGRASWLRGYPEQAMRVARHTLEKAEELDHPLTSCISMVWNAPIFHWSGDWDSADEIIQRLLRHAANQALGPYYAVGLGLQGELAVKRGEPARGIELLRNCLGALQAGRHQILTTVFETSLAKGLAQLGHTQEAITTIEGALGRVGADGETFDMPEILRTKGRILALSPRAKPGSAEAALREALDRANKQSALGWALRSATTLAELWHRQNWREEALALLAPIFAEFTEGADTADLKRAGALLRELGGTASR